MVEHFVMNSVFSRLFFPSHSFFLLSFSLTSSSVVSPFMFLCISGFVHLADAAIGLAVGILQPRQPEQSLRFKYLARYCTFFVIASLDEPLSRQSPCNTQPSGSLFKVYLCTEKNASMPSGPTSKFSFILPDVREDWFTTFLQASYSHAHGETGLKLSPPQRSQVNPAEEVIKCDIIIILSTEILLKFLQYVEANFRSFQTCQPFKH